MSRTSELAVSTTWGQTRIETLSDGVFAIAIALLVLDIASRSSPALCRTPKPGARSVRLARCSRAS